MLILYDCEKKLILKFLIFIKLLKTKKLWIAKKYKELRRIKDKKYIIVLLIIISFLYIAVKM